ncbi:hypothetical protein [Actinoplanes sp. NPDC049265]
MTGCGRQGPLTPCR